MQTLTGMNSLPAKQEQKFFSGIKGMVYLLKYGRKEWYSFTDGRYTDTTKKIYTKLYMAQNHRPRLI